MVPSSHLAADLLVIRGDFDGNGASVMGRAGAGDLIVVDVESSYFTGIELAKLLKGRSGS